MQGRSVTPFNDLDFKPYDLYGTPVEGLSWRLIEFDRDKGRGSYILKLGPKSPSRPHEHTHRERFLVLEGELIDADGTVFKTGDFVDFDAGTKHFSASPKGCVLLVWLMGFNRALEGAEKAQFLAEISGK